MNPCDEEGVCDQNRAGILEFRSTVHTILDTIIDFHHNRVQFLMNSCHEEGV
eukprot:gene21998-biopygen7719